MDATELRARSLLSWKREERCLLELLRPILEDEGVSAVARALGMKDRQQLHNWLREPGRSLERIYLYRLWLRYPIPRAAYDFKLHPIGDVLMGRIPEAEAA